MLGPGVSARGQKTIVIRPNGDYQTGDSLFGGIFENIPPSYALKKEEGPNRGRAGGKREKEARKGSAARAGILSGVSPGGFANCSDQVARGAT